jgi:cold shock CspA family protein
MRTDGTLAKWNDDRGFGFITPNEGGPEIFAHISAFPRDGQRPRIGERVVFEIGTGKDGKQQAKNIVCPSRPTAKPYRLSQPVKGPRKPGLLGRLIPLALLVALGAYAYDGYVRRTAPHEATTTQFSDMKAAAVRNDPLPSASFRATTPTEFRGTEASAASSPAASASFHCDGRTHCSQMTSCAEAKFFLRNCPNVRMDGDRKGRDRGDGVPCEQEWCTSAFAK